MSKLTVKASSELYRTIHGERYIGWRSDINNYDIATYRKAGIKCVRRGVELFLREADAERALVLERFVSQSPIL